MPRDGARVVRERDVADALNADFVSIKVDREERPDVDRVYMTFVQSTTGSGGWPMTVFLTPELKPFFGGTYFPPHVEVGPAGVHGSARRDRPRAGSTIARASTTPRRSCSIGCESVDRRRRPSQAESSRRRARTRSPKRSSSTRWRSIAGTAASASAPKFPRPSELLFLLREHARTGAQPPLMMATDTLRAMALGGMRDHVGGGFHRYSVDAEWRVPHFEKMLYDQAQLVLAYLEAGAGDRRRVLSRRSPRTRWRYVAPRYARSGAAASIPPKTPTASPPDGSGEEAEGAFYVWTDDEIGALLGDDADFVRQRFGIEPDGNAPQDPQGEFTGQNLLYTAQSIEDIAARHRADARTT